MLMREVDEAVRQDEVSGFTKKYGLPLGIVFVLVMATFGGLLFWRESQESDLQEDSEQLIQAIDELDAGNIDIADGKLAQLEGGSAGAAASAALLRAGIALQQERVDDAAALYDEVANNAELPQELRDIAAIRAVAAQYDTLDPQQVIDRIGGMAQPDSAYFGSAGELVAHAYIAQGKLDQAGPLLVSMAKNENVPQSIRGRARQLAGRYGFDAIEDVDAALAEITGEDAEQPTVQLVE